MTGSKIFLFCVVITMWFHKLFHEKLIKSLMKLLVTLVYICLLLHITMFINGSQTVYEPSWTFILMKVHELGGNFFAKRHISIWNKLSILTKSGKGMYSPAAPSPTALISTQKITNHTSTYTWRHNIQLVMIRF